MIAIQDAGSWHHEGLYMGVHWLWWLLWIALVVVLGWAFGRLFADRRGARREAERTLQAESMLRERLARGEIDEEEFARKITALQTSRGDRDA